MPAKDFHEEDPFITSTPTHYPRKRRPWKRRLVGQLLHRGYRITSVRMTALLFFFVIFVFMKRGLFALHLTAFSVDTSKSFPDATCRILTAKQASSPHPAFPPPDRTQYRAPDSLDTFSSYKYRAACNISSLDLHSAFSPLCKSRQDMLDAMAGGGRIGFDAPYMPRGCDMRWFTSEEVCEILSRFERVVMVGDSMIRHVIGGLHILLRKDIGYGAVTDWNFSDQERKHCFCNTQFNVKGCSVQGIYKTADVLRNDPTSFKCAKPVNVLMEEIVTFPVPLSELNRLREAIGPLTTKKKAFILGHGLWSDLDIPQSLRWLDTIVSSISSTSTREWHGLFLTPNAAGKKKPDEWIQSQGNKALMLYEEKVGAEAKKRGLEHLGMWNMSIQATTYDGVHLDLRGNLVKTMMVLNWLNMLPA